MSEELKQLSDAVYELRVAVEEKQKKADALLDEKTAKINESIDALEKRLADVDKKASRQSFANGNATQDDEVKAVFEKFCRQKAETDFVKFAKANLDTKAHRIIVDSDGGYGIVPPQMLGIIAGELKEFSPMRQVATVVSISTSEAVIVSYNAGATSAWVNEQSAVEETATPKLQKITLPAHEMRSAPRVSEQMLEDAAFNVTDFISQYIGEEFARLEGKAFIDGDGNNKPTGVIAYPTITTTAYEFGKIQRVNISSNGNNNVIGADGLIRLVGALKSGYLNGAAFLMNRDSIHKVRQLKLTNASFYLWQPSYQAGQPSTLLGYPVFEATDLPNEGSGTLPVLFGNFRRGYQIVDRTGMALQIDPYTKKPFVEFYARKRVGGGVVNFEAIKIGQTTTAA